jgi:hypothetical protein
MPALTTLITMADMAYDIPEHDGDLTRLAELEGWDWLLHSRAYRITSGITGARAATYVNRRSQEIIISIRGTSSATDVMSDIKLGIGIGPNAAGPIFRLVEKVVKNFGHNYNVTLVGHSLGGGIAQLVGFWAQVPYVTFNAPGMNHVKNASHINVAKPLQLVRSVRAPRTGNRSLGINFRLETDPVSKIGKHIGMLLILGSATEVESPHRIGTVLSVAEKKWIGGQNPMRLMGTWDNHHWTCHYEGSFRGGY